MAVIPNEAGWSWAGVGEGSPRSDLSGLAWTFLLDQTTAQVGPLGIRLLYQRDFLRAAPTFQFLLAGNGCANVVGVLEVHKTFNEVFAGKAWHQPMLVLVYANGRGRW